MKRSPCYLLILLAVCLQLSSAFVPSNFVQQTNINHKKSQPIATLNNNKKQSSALHISIGSIASSSIGTISTALSSILPTTTPLRRHAKLLLLLLSTVTTFIIATKKRSSLLWPGTHVSSDSSEYPLPPGSFGCPFIGYDLFSGTKDYGYMAKIHKLSRKMANTSKIFKSYTFGMPIVSITGTKNVKQALKKEFKEDGVNMFMVGDANLGDLLGDKSVLYENKSSTHSMLRRLAGSAMTPAAINDALPSIQEAANYQVDQLLQQTKDGKEVEMERIFTDYTLDLAWKQILGLDLKEEEIPTFHKAVQDWIGGMGSLFLLLPFRIPGLLTYTKVGKARMYLESKVEDKLVKLDRDGPDNSTLSKLYFATDEETGERMTRKQVIDNALILILAGSETSASTLTTTSLMLALNKNVWGKIKAEQREIVAKHGEESTRQSIDDCVYLDAAIREALRIKPLEGMEFRQVSDSNMVVDGNRIPKNWIAMLNIKNTHWEDPAVYKEDGSHMDIEKGFVPERWLDESTKPGEWMPFGDGRRRCIGERLAWAEMKVMLSILARRVEDYELVNEDCGNKWKPEAFLSRPLDGVLVKATPATVVREVRGLLNINVSNENPRQ